MDNSLPSSASVTRGLSSAGSQTITAFSADITTAEWRGLKAIVDSQLPAEGRGSRHREEAEHRAAAVPRAEAAAHAEVEAEAANAEAAGGSIMAFLKQSRFFVIGLTCAAAAIAQERFDSPDAAAQALIDAASEHDSTRLAALLGPRATGILTSGNPTQDRNEQTEFARLAREKHRLEVSPMSRNRVVLAIGDEDWPFPIPIVRTGGTQNKWSFDASQTPAEMRARRIGANELDAIEILHGYVDAQMKYASEEHDKNGILLYASHLMSTPGHHDGLYWRGEAEPLIPQALAGAESSGTASASAKPYHGYFFRVLIGQGPNAPGGAHTYVAKNKLMGGFGLIAWPARYGVTGVHTFIVNQDGEVFDKDLSPATSQSAASITRFNPDQSWQPVD